MDILCRLSSLPNLFVIILVYLVERDRVKTEMQLSTYYSHDISVPYEIVD